LIDLKLYPNKKILFSPQARLWILLGFLCISSCGSDPGELTASDRITIDSLTQKKIRQEQNNLDLYCENLHKNKWDFILDSIYKFRVQIIEEQKKALYQTINNNLNEIPTKK
jgi:hypothetical protein